MDNWRLSWNCKSWFFQNMKHVTKFTIIHNKLTTNNGTACKGCFPKQTKSTIIPRKQKKRSTSRYPNGRIIMINVVILMRVSKTEFLHNQLVEKANKHRRQEDKKWIARLPRSRIRCFVMDVSSRLTSKTPEAGTMIMQPFPVRSKFLSILYPS